MSVNPDDFLQPLERAFESVEKTIIDIVNRFNAAVSHVNDWKYVLAPVIMPIISGLDAVADGLVKLQKLIDYALKHQMPIVSLIYQSFKWIDGIQRPLNCVYSQKELNIAQADSGPSYHNEELAEWSGTAKSVYDSKVSEQHDAINAMASKADSISKWLIEIAQANVDYMVQLAKLANGFLGALTKAAIDACTVVDLPFSVDKLSGAIGNLVSGGLDLLVDVANRFMQTLGRIRDTSSWMNDNALPASKWPQAVHPSGA